MADSLPYTNSAADTRKGTSHPINEDALRVLDAGNPLVSRARRGVLYAVADGVSSTNQGQYAAQRTSEWLERFFHEDHDADPAALRRLLVDIDGELSGGGRGKAACTLSALWLCNGAAHVLHVGNSEILRMRDGDIQPLTPVIEKGSRSMLRNFVGMGNLDAVLHTTVQPFEVGDVYFLLTDGIREALPSNGAIGMHWVRAQLDPDRFVAAVIEAVEERSVEDDSSIIVVQVAGLETIRLSLKKARVR